MGSLLAISSRSPAGCCHGPNFQFHPRQSHYQCILDGAIVERSLKSTKWKISTATTFSYITPMFPKHGISHCSSNFLCSSYTSHLPAYHHSNMAPRSLKNKSVAQTALK